AADLSAVVVNDERLAGQSRIDEPGQDHAVGAGLPRANDVEEPADDDGEAELAGTGQSQKLIDRLARAVRPAGAGGCAENEIVLFRPHRFGVFAIDLAGAGQKKLDSLARLLPAAQLVEPKLRPIGFA